MAHNRSGFTDAQYQEALRMRSLSRKNREGLVSVVGAQTEEPIPSEQRPLTPQLDAARKQMGSAFMPHPYVRTPGQPPELTQETNRSEAVQRQQQQPAPANRPQNQHQHVAQPGKSAPRYTPFGS